MTEPTAPRELGVETTPCPVCGTALKSVQLADGGVSSEDCTQCTAPMPAPEKASETPVPREQGTTVVTKEN